MIYISQIDDFEDSEAINTQNEKWKFALNFI